MVVIEVNNSLKKFNTSFKQLSPTKSIITWSSVFFMHVLYLFFFSFIVQGFLKLIIRHRLHVTYFKRKAHQKQIKLYRITIKDRALSYHYFRHAFNNKNNNKNKRLTKKNAPRMYFRRIWNVPVSETFSIRIRPTYECHRASQGLITHHQ